MIAALMDAHNQAPESNLGPLIVGFVVLVIGLAFGTNAGYAINPARGLGPRLITEIFGWGRPAFPGSDRRRRRSHIAYGNLVDLVRDQSAAYLRQR